MHHDLPYRAYKELYNKEPDYRLLVRYHGRFTGYNANVRKTATTIEFSLSRKFEECEPEVQLGAMQFLLNKLFRTKVKSAHIEFYHTFLKKMSDLAPVTKSDPALAASFERVNRQYFGDMMSRPNLVWGGTSMSLLGTYTYATDTITISQVMADDQHLLDYVMHHEMLHKKHKFNHSSSRTHSHTKLFRTDEKAFADKDAETKLKRYLAQKRYGLRRARSPVARPMPGKRRNFVQRLMDWD